MSARWHDDATAQVHVALSGAYWLTWHRLSASGFLPTPLLFSDELLAFCFDTGVARDSVKRDLSTNATFNAFQELFSRVI
jgi:hypothetical protein